MNHGFWKQLPRPLTVLAPMSGYTDAAFRAILAKYGKPDVMMTEFVPADGLCSSGRDNLLPLLWKTTAERPVVAQIFGGDPGNYEQAARFVAELGFDGIDVNMGCPSRIVEKRLGGSALIKDPARAREIIAAAQAGAGGLPVSVKTRLGYHRSEVESWLVALIEARPAALTVHARTRADAYSVPAKWEAIARVVELARAIEPDPALRPLIIGNGDVASRRQALERAEASGCDGVMIGRALLGNPWLLNRHTSREQLPFSQVLAVLLEHTDLYLHLFGPDKPLARMKKHYKAYVNGFRGAPALRAELMAVTSYEELQRIVSEAVRQPYPRHK